MEEFKELGINKKLLDKIKKQGFKEPTDIQKKAIPLVLKGRNIIGEAATGSGKTLVFIIPIISNIKKSKVIKALVLTPTRELAKQIKDMMLMYSDELNVVLIYGGRPIEKQIKELKKAEVVIATPGRLLDHIQRGTVDLSNIKILVLDEADRMLDMGFINDIKEIIKKTPEEKQFLLFSATIPRTLKDIIKLFKIDPLHIKSEDKIEKLEQFYYDIDKNKKFSLLVHLLKTNKGKSIVFCNTRKNVDFLFKHLKEKEIKIISLHGGYTQEKRERIMNSFRNLKQVVLITTDVAARGIDVKDIDNIYNYDIPTDSKQYTHRIGRTARAKSSGKAISLVSSHEHEAFSRIYERNKIVRLELPFFKRIHIKLKQERYIKNNRKRNYKRMNYKR